MLQRKYRIDELAPPQLRRRLIKHLTRRRDPQNLPITLASHFRLEGDFFSYSREPLQQRVQPPPAAPLVEEPTHTNGTRTLQRLQRLFGPAVFYTVRELENLQEGIERMLVQVEVPATWQQVAWNVCLAVFALRPGRPIGFALETNIERHALQTVELRVYSADISNDRVSIEFCMAARGIYIPKRGEDGSLKIPTGVDPHFRYPAWVVKWESLQKDPLRVLRRLGSLRADMPVPAYVLERYLQEQ